MRATELTDEQWQLLEPLLPPRRPRGRPRADDRNTLNGILVRLPKASFPIVFIKPAIKPRPLKM